MSVAEDGLIVLFRSFIKGFSDVVHYTHKLEENEGVNYENIWEKVIPDIGTEKLKAFWLE